MKTKPYIVEPVDPELLESQIGFQLRLAQLAVFGELIERMREIGLRPVDLSVLMLIEAEPGLRQHVIGDKLKIQRPNVVALIDVLQERGLVDREVDKTDRRANQLILTADGRALLALRSPTAAIRSPRTPTSASRPGAFVPSMTVPPESM